MSVLGLTGNGEDKSMKRVMGVYMLAVSEFAVTSMFAAVTVLFGRKKAASVPADAVLGVVSLVNTTYVDSKSLEIQERVLATALVRATKYNLRMMQNGPEGVVFMAMGGSAAKSCNQLMMFFTELKNDFDNKGLKLRFGMTRGHELETAGRLCAHGAAGEISMNRNILNEAPAVKIKSRVIGQMRFASV
jgi:hypothetical protein